MYLHTAAISKEIERVLTVSHSMYFSIQWDYSFEIGQIAGFEGEQPSLYDWYGFGVVSSLIYSHIWKKVGMWTFQIHFFCEKTAWRHQAIIPAPMLTYHL